MDHKLIISLLLKLLSVIETKLAFKCSKSIAVFSNQPKANGEVGNAHQIYDKINPVLFNPLGNAGSTNPFLLT